MAKKKSSRKKSTSRKKATKKSTRKKASARKKTVRTSPESRKPKQVAPHTEQWRDVVVAILGIVLVVALIVLYFLLR